MRGFLVALQFLTRIPVNLPGEITPGDLVNSTLYYPLTGLLLGIILVTVSHFSYAYFPPGVAAALILAALALITGGLHLDGFMDTMDGLGSGAPRERALEIMRDSHAGAFGVIGVVVLLILKLSLLQALGRDCLVEALLVMPVISRWSAVAVMPLAGYARKEYGLGKVLVEEVGWKQVGTITVFTLAVSYYFLGLKSIWLLLVTAGLLYLWAAYLGRRIGGLTGDILGATIEMAEVLVLLALLVI